MMLNILVVSLKHEIYFYASLMFTHCNRLYIWYCIYGFVFCDSLGICNNKAIKRNKYKNKMFSLKNWALLSRVIALVSCCWHQTNFRGVGLDSVYRGGGTRVHPAPLIWLCSEHLLHETLRSTFGLANLTTVKRMMDSLTAVSPDPIFPSSSLKTAWVCKQSPLGMLCCAIKLIFSLSFSVSIPHFLFQFLLILHVCFMLLCFSFKNSRVYCHVHTN